jgi:UDP-glucose:(heptosyl)LPS alpha-1,3-glucosyltransferase
VSATPRRIPSGGPRIALIRSRYDAFGGAERFVERALAALKAQGASVTVVTRRWPGNDGAAIIVDPFHLGSLWRDRSFARAVCERLARERFDLVQSHERLACCDVYRAGDGVHAEWLAQRARAQSPLRALATRMNPHHRWLLDAERALFTGARLKAVICNSRMVAGEIRRHFGTAEGKLHVIPNGIDCAEFHPGLRDEHRAAVRQQLGIAPGSRVFLHVGSGFERKGVAPFLEALAKLEPSDCAIVVGKDKQAHRYRALADRLGIGKRVVFAGAVSDVRPYYGAADVFVLATLYDPFPNAALEAMACALPVVTGPKCGTAELLAGNRGGRVVDPLDAEALAAAMAELGGGVARTLGLEARALVAPLTMDGMARSYAALYSSLLPAA